MYDKKRIELLIRVMFRTKPFDARLCLLCIFFPFLSSALPNAASATEQTKSYSESQVKVALVYKLMHFVEWPANTPLTLCVYKPNAEDASSFGLMPSQTESGNALKVMLLYKHNAAAVEQHECKISFVSSDANSADAQKFLAKVSHENSLTIGETNQFIKQGGMINLVRKNSTIKFEINLDALKKAGLNIPSQVLRIADQVYPSEATE